MRTIFLLVVALLLFARVGTAQTNFVVLKNDGAWTWYNDPRAVYHNGIFYFGYVRNADGRGALSAFNPQTGVVTDLWASVLTQKDDHNNPGLLVKEDGTMLAIYARHGGDRFFSYRLSTSTNPASPADWGAEILMTNTTAGVTYANPFQLSTEAGKIYNFTRNLNFNPTVLTSTNGGSTWSAPQLFIRNGNGSIRPYVKYSSDYEERIDFLYTDGHPRNITNSLYHLFYEGASFRKTDGALVKNFADLPIQHDLGERGSVIYQYSDTPTNDPNSHIPTGRAWCWETAYQTNGNPVCVFTVQRDQVAGTSWTEDRIYYYYARWTGTNWQKRFIAHAGRPLYEVEDDYAGGICLDPENSNIIYISSNAQNPFNLSNTTNVPLRANSRYEIYRGTTTDGGLSFSWETVTTNSAADNLRPYIPRGQTGTPAVIWFRGTYTTYTSYNCEVVGMFPTTIPKRLSISISNPSVPSFAMTNLNNELQLTAVVEDAESPTFSWTTVSGPANAIFSNPNAAITTARFPTKGTYVLRVTGNDGVSVDSDEVSVMAGTISSSDPDASCSLWLKMDSAGGLVATDSSAMANHGTLSGGATWRPSGGARSGAIELDGVSGLINVPDSDTLDNTSAFTLAYWFFPRAVPPDSAGLVSKRTGITDNNAYTTYYKNDGRVYVDIDGSNNRFSSSALLSTGQWHHVAITFSGSAASSERAAIWINGQLDTIASESSTFIPNYSSSVRIGNTHPGATNWLNGLMDDIRFYRRALGSAEIAALGIIKFAPAISLGALPSVTNRVSASLSAVVTPGSSGVSVSQLWSKLDGPGNAVFGTPLSPNTTVTFHKSGNYVLQLAASNGEIDVVQRMLLGAAANTNVFEDWIAATFPGQTNSAVVGHDSDPEGDGVPNFVEFAFGLDPQTNDASGFQANEPGLPVGEILHISGTNYLALLLKRPVGRIGVNYAAESSSNLLSWTFVEPATVLTNGNFTETVTFRDSVPVHQAPRRFMRARVTSF